MDKVPIVESLGREQRVWAEEQDGKNKYDVLVEKILHSVCNAMVAKVAVDQQKP